MLASQRPYLDQVGAARSTLRCDRASYLVMDPASSLFEQASPILSRLLGSRSKMGKIVGRK